MKIAIVHVSDFHVEEQERYNNKKIDKLGWDKRTVWRFYKPIFILKLEIDIWIFIWNWKEIQNNAASRL